MAAQIKVCAGSYHKNKYITEVIARFDANEEKMLRTAIQQAPENEDTEYYNKSVQYVLGKRPEHEETITDTETYLLNQMAGVSIWKHDPKARNGGVSKPHVSHILPARLSSRPKGWSKEPLKHFAPILANGSEVRMICKQQPELTPLQKKAVKKYKGNSIPESPARSNQYSWKPGNRMDGTGYSTASFMTIHVSCPSKTRQCAAGGAPATSCLPTSTRGTICQ